MAECDNCGGFVTDDYVRVFGDNENRVDDCRNCPTVRSTAEESDDGRDVLLRELRGTADRDGGEGGGGTDQLTEGDDQPTGNDDHSDGTRRTDEGASRDRTGDEEGGRLQSGLAAMVAALRS